MRVRFLLLSLVVLVSTSALAAESFRAFKLKSLDGVEQKLSDVLGAKATLVVFFFPSCPYCNAAFPHVQKLYDSYKAQGLSMVWINVLPEEQKLIAAWREQHGYTVPVLLGSRSTPNDYKVMMTPTHYLLDARGQVLSKKAGFTAGDEQLLEAEIRKALATN
jgi:thiol-disulfide isomerase/thioredoxin